MAKNQKYYSRKKYSRLKKKKSIFKNRFFWFSILGITVFAGLFYFLIFSPVFQIKTIVVEGTYFVNVAEVREGINRITEKNILFFPTKSMFVLRKREVKNYVSENFFPVKEIIVKKKFFNQLSIKIQEKEAKAIYCTDECFLADKEGFVFQSIGKETASNALPIIFFEYNIASEDKLLDEALLEFISLINTRLKERANINIQEFRVFPSKIEAKTETGLTLYFSSEKSPDLQIEDLILLLNDEVLLEIEALEYIDLRFDKIFCK
ncbi:MAG: hypothetical protein U9Q96_01965 [Patescibacteria group bacterium]|nr:hypothetical protein [Patescibacteria group bacterium]